MKSIEILQLTNFSISSSEDKKPAYVNPLYVAGLEPSDTSGDGTIVHMNGSGTIEVHESTTEVYKRIKAALEKMAEKKI